MHSSKGECCQSFKAGAALGAELSAEHTKLSDSPLRRQCVVLMKDGRVAFLLMFRAAGQGVPQRRLKWNTHAPRSPQEDARYTDEDFAL